MTPQLQSEQDHQKRAFEQYYALGGKRSHERVARELGVSVASVKAWSRSFGWAKRVAERDAAVARQVADQTLKSDVDDLSRNKKIVQMAMVKLAKAIANGQIKMQLGDLDRLIRLQSFLDGYVEANSWSDMSMEELAARFHWVMMNITSDELDCFMAEYQRLQASNARGGMEPPP